MVLWQVLFWAILAVVLIGGEAITVQLTAIWFGAGSLAAFVSSFFGIDFYLQFIIFIAVSSILLLSTRPLVKRFLSSGHVKTNADSVIGNECVVKEEVNNLEATGRVFANGLSWAARSIDSNCIFTPEQICIVTAIEGVTLIVKAK